MGDWAFTTVHFRPLDFLTSSCGLETVGSSTKKRPSTSLHKLPLLLIQRKEINLSLDSKKYVWSLQIFVLHYGDQVNWNSIYWRNRSVLWMNVRFEKILFLFWDGFHESTLKLNLMADASIVVVLMWVLENKSLQTPWVFFLHMLFCVSLVNWYIKMLNCLGCQ